MAAPRNTTRRDRHRKIISRGHPPCAICGEDIDYDAPHTDPRSFQVDHIIPVFRGGADSLDNKQASHRKCNRDKSFKLAGEASVDPDALIASGEVEFVTSRRWW